MIKIMTREELLENLQDKAKDLGIEIGNVMTIGDQIDSRIMDNVLVIRNERFIVEFNKIKDDIIFKTNQSNQEVKNSYIRELNHLNTIVEIAEYHLSELQLQEETDAELEHKENQKIVDQVNETMKEHNDEEQKLADDFLNEEKELSYDEQVELNDKLIAERIEEAKKANWGFKVPNFKNITGNGKVNRKIFFTKYKGQYIRHDQRVVFNNDDEMIRDYISFKCNLYTKSNLIFIDKESGEYYVAINHGDYEFEIL